VAASAGGVIGESLRGDRAVLDLVRLRGAALRHSEGEDAVYRGELEQELLEERGLSGGSERFWRAESNPKWRARVT
jgi:hypothetical protein